MQAIQPLLVVHGFSRSSDGADPAGERERVNVAPEEKQAFVRRVYLYGILFVLFSVISWMIVSICDIKMHKCPVPNFVWLLGAIICHCILLCCRVSWIRPPIRWVLTVLIIICITILVAYFIEDVRPLLLLGAFSVAIATLVVLHAYGALCPQSCLPGIIITTCVCLVSFILLVIVLIVFWFTKNRDVHLSYNIILFIAIVVWVSFQAQYIHGRADNIPLEDAMSCGISFYLSFGIILICISQFYNYYSGK